MPRQRVLTADVQGVSLVVIEQAKAITKREVGESAVDVAEAERELIGVRQVDLPAVANAWRAQRQLPAVDSCALNGNGEEEIRVVEIIVVEKVFRAGQKVVGVQRPSAERNRYAELVLLIALSV